MELTRCNKVKRLNDNIIDENARKTLGELIDSQKHRHNGQVFKFLFLLVLFDRR